MSIRREIEVTRKGLSRPIDVTYGTNILPIEFMITDFELPEGATAEAYAMGSSSKLVKQSCVISKNIISFIPEIGLFEEGKNVLQLAVTYAGKDLFSFYIPVNCQKTMVYEGAQDLENDPTFVAIVMQMKEDIANKITIPEAAEVGQILEVEEVDENGKPTKFIAVDKPTSSGEGGAVANELWGKSFQNRGRADGKNIDDLMNNENQGQWWVEVSKVQGTHAFDSGYYFLICYSNVQVAIKFVSSDTTPRPIKYRYYTNNKWYGWSNNCSSNPNLLINGDFQVNQRGSTTYEIPSSTWNTIYTVDRWALTGQGTKATYSNNKVTVVSNSNDSYLRQIFEKPLNGTYIATVKVTSLTGTASCYMRDDNQVAYGSKILSVGINHIEINGSNLKELMLMISANTTITIEYIKLEQGSIATPFIPRLYAEELVLCQRYYQVVNTHSPMLYKYPTGYKYRVRMVFNQMRVIPTIKWFKVTTYDNNDLDVFSTGHEIVATYQGEEKNDCLTLNVSFNSASKSGCYGVLITSILDAEIY